MISGTTFLDVSAFAGFGATIVGNTGTAAWGDFNGDGLPDLWQGNHYAYAPMLWLNNGDGTFDEILQSVMDRPESAYNPQREDYWGDIHGTAWGDFDNDGDQDAIALLGGAGTPSGGEKSQLLLNENGRLEDIGEDARIQYPQASGRSVAWFDYDRDGLLDFYHTAVYRTEDSAPAALFRQKPAGFFVNVDEVIGATTVEEFVAAIYLGDVTGDGVLDIITGDHKVLDGATGPRFDTIAELDAPVTATDLVIGDFDGDLRNDVYSATQKTGADVVHANQLFLNGPSGLTDATEALGLDQLLYSTRSVVAGDFDNDMDLDIFLFNGFKKGTSEDNGALPHAMLWNDGTGRFTADEELGLSITPSAGIPLSATTMDYDRNGFLDLFFTNDEATDQLIQNTGNGNHWIEIDLKGRVSNRDGIGSQIFVTAGGKTQLRDVTSGSHQEWSQNEKIVHVGLGDNTTIDRIEIRWTNGIVQVLTDVAADQVLTVVETQGTERRTGTAGDDEIMADHSGNPLHGGSGNDVLTGYSGDDILTGDDGNDVLDGREGDDLFDGGRGADVFWGRSGYDIVDYSMSLPDIEVHIGAGGVGAGGYAEGDTYNGIDGIIGSAGDDLLHGNNADNDLRGEKGDDTLSGVNGDDHLWGGAGRDLLDGGDGNDHLIGGAGADTLTGGSGKDTATHNDAKEGVTADLAGSVEATGDAKGDTYSGVENLHGSHFDDRLYGDAGNNRLFGNTGADRLVGRSGNDRLVGGDGSDLFVFHVNSGLDVVADFETGVDRLSIQGRDYADASEVLNAFQQVGDDAILVMGDDQVTLSGVQVTDLFVDDIYV